MSSYNSNSYGALSSSSSSAHVHGSSSRARSQSYAAHSNDDSSLLDDCLATAQRNWDSLLRFWRTRGRQSLWSLLLAGAHQLRRNMAARRLLSFPHVLALVWVLVLLWGERWVFHSTVERCRWEDWEKWPPEATPHHLIFVADPQLIDPHSYPGRPWPLSSLTYTITDNYLRRSYTQLQEQLRPDTVFFLGDLFDGGREWPTFHGDTEDQSWNPRPKGEISHAKRWRKKYGELFWQREYVRFTKLFVDTWGLGGFQAGLGQRGRRLIASLPGNHDFGFGSGVKIPARDRFEAFFGDVNRVDVIANHTFVSVDTLSLSARVSGDRSVADLTDVYRPAEEFLSTVQATKRKAVDRELRHLRGEPEHPLQKHEVDDLQGAVANSPLISFEGQADLPTILLSHVPLYRPSGTPCGPKREHWPPANPHKDMDHRNAISVSKGYQYQNVLEEVDSVDLVSKIGNVVHAFSGDDHDYCELTHGENKNYVKEITVKSISMAMGVPTPGFVMVSMYNPIDDKGSPLSGDQSQTLQTHLCLLPNQLSTYARYGGLAFVCLVMLTIRAFLVPILNLEPFALEPEKPTSVLPIFKEKNDDHDPKRHHQPGYGFGSSASAFHSSSPHRSGTRDRSASFTPGIKANGLASQARNAPARGPSHGNGHGNTKGLGRHSSNREKNRGSKWDMAQGPKIEINLGDDDEYYYDAGKSRWKSSTTRRTGGIGSRGNLRVVARELWTTAWRVLWIVACYWAWLAWKG